MSKKREYIVEFKYVKHGHGSAGFRATSEAKAREMAERDPYSGEWVEEMGVDDHVADIEITSVSINE